MNMHTYVNFSGNAPRRFATTRSNSEERSA